MTNLSEAHADWHTVNGWTSCPLDCAESAARANRHVHESACGHPVECYDEQCLGDRGPSPLVACAACQPAPTPCPGPHTDPWTDGIPF